MVKLVSLYATNFKKLDFNTPLRFSDGISVISGLNEAGKSTILDAILYALYAKVMKPPGHVKDEDLLAYTTSRATVVLEFTIGEKHYKVSREIRRSGTNKATLEEQLGDDHWKVIATKGRDVTATITSLLGDISFDEMVSSTIVAQKDLDRLVQHGSDRWKVINAFLHLESFNEAIDTLNEEKKDLEGTGPTRPGQINSEKAKLEQLNRDLSEYERKESQNKGLNEEIGKLRSETTNLTARYNELSALQAQLSKYDEVTSQRQRSLDQARAKQEQIDNHRYVVSTYQRQLQAAQDELARYSDLPSEEEITKITDTAAKVQAADIRISQLNNSVRTKAEELKPMQNEFQGYDKTAIESARQSRKSLLPYAGGTAAAFVIALAAFALSISILAWVAVVAGVIMLVLLARNVSRMSRLVRLEGLLGKFELYEGKTRELRSAQEELANQTREGEDMLGALKAALGVPARYGGVAMGPSPLERAEEIRRQYSLDVQTKGSAELSVRKLTNGLVELRSKFNEASAADEVISLKKTAESLALPTLPPGVDFSKEQLKKTIEDKEQVGQRVAGNNTRIEGNERRIAENTLFLTEHRNIKEDVDAQRKLVGQLEFRLKVVRAAKDGIEKAAESRRVRFRPGVETFMGEILPSLTSDRYKAVLLDEDFGVQVFDPEAGEYRPKDVFSGGTEDQFLLAMRLAFALALLPEVKGATSQFLWLDEPLGSSDETRRSGIVEYLSVSLSRLFSQIFIVSHVGGLEDQIPSVIRLENGRISV